MPGVVGGGLKACCGCLLWVSSALANHAPFPPQFPRPTDPPDHTKLTGPINQQPQRPHAQKTDRGHQQPPSAHIPHTKPTVLTTPTTNHPCSPTDAEGRRTTRGSSSPSPSTITGSTSAPAGQSASQSGQSAQSAQSVSVFVFLGGGGDAVGVRCLQVGLSVGSQGSQCTQGSQSL